MPEARLKQRYLDEIRPGLIERFGYSSPMQAPRIDKITVNMGVGDTVIVRESRPVSRTKRWRLVEIVEKAQ